MALRLIVLSLAALQAASLVLDQEQQEGGKHPFCMHGKLAPSVFLIGVQKSGTSSLWSDLVARFPLRAGHRIQYKNGEMEPQFFDKEISFFGREDRYKKGEKFYLDHFDECKSARAREQSIDGSPDTFFNGETSAGQIKKFYGDKAKDLKFIIMVRDPTSRVESAYWHFYPGKNGNFDAFVKKHLPRAKSFVAAGQFERLKGRKQGDSLFTSSLYAKHMKHWLEEFDASQFTVVTLQQYKQSPKKTMEFIAKRTGMKLHGPGAAALHKNAWADTHMSHQTMSAKTRKELTAFYKPFNEEFDEMVAENGMGFGDTSKNMRFRMIETETPISESSQTSD